MQIAAPLGRPFCYAVMGVPHLIVGLFLETVTVAGSGGGRYAGVLLLALIFTGVAASYFIQAFRSGGLATRFVTILLFLPVLFVFADFCLRAPYLFE